MREAMVSVDALNEQLKRDKIEVYEKAEAMARAEGAPRKHSPSLHKKRKITTKSKRKMIAKSKRTNRKK